MKLCLENVFPAGHRLQGLTASASESLLRVWLVDDDSHLRGLLAKLLNCEADIDCARTFPSTDAVRQALACERPPQVLLVDMNLKGEDGIDAVRELRALAPRTRVFIMSVFYDSHHEARALQAGAQGFMVKHDVERMIQRLRSCGPLGAGEAAPGLARPARATTRTVERP